MEAALNANLKWYLINFIHGAWRFRDYNKFDEPLSPCQNGKLNIHASFRKFDEIVSQWFSSKDSAFIQMLFNFLNTGVLENKQNKNM